MSVTATWRDKVLAALAALPLFAWMAVIWWISAQPAVPRMGETIGVSDHLVDYTAHAATFGLLTLFAYLAVRHGSGSVPDDRRTAILAAMAFAAVYAAVDEAHQAFVPGRWATLPDWLADVAGIVLAGGLLQVRQVGLRRPSSRQV
jgi:VanZ family protein